MISIAYLDLATGADADEVALAGLDRKARLEYSIHCMWESYDLDDLLFAAVEDLVGVVITTSAILLRRLDGHTKRVNNK